MAIAKQFADLLTASRVLIAALLVWLGRVNAPQLLAAAALLLLLSWITDTLDGPLARLGGGSPSWVGDHDLEMDVVVSLGVLAYLVGAHFLAPGFAVAYLGLWALAIWRWGWKREPSMLFQAPIYLWLIVIAMRDAPAVGRWLIAYPLAAIILTWPRFPREIVPEFLAGMSAITKRQPTSRG